MQLTAKYIESILAPCHCSKNIFIAYSGGVDSHVLLHLVASINLFKHKIAAIYVHHGLYAEADGWAEHCAKITHQLGVSFITTSVDAKANRGESPEEAARNARYQALQELLGSEDVLLLAQHQDDQLETVLLQLFRGAGLQGLSGMSKSSKFGQGLMLRPLLEFSRDQIETYARHQQLNWIEDHSNQDIAFNRNYLRRQVIPVLKQRWPSVGKTVSRASRHCAKAQQMIDTIVKKQFEQVFNAAEKTLSIRQLKKFSDYEQKQVIRHWFQTLDLRMPSENIIEKIFSELIEAKQSSDPKIQYGSFCVRRYRNDLYMVTDQVLTNVTEKISWPKHQRQLKLHNNGNLRLKEAKFGVSIDHWQKVEITVAYRQGGEKIRLQGREGHHSLKKLFQEQSIPPWQRARMPLIYFDGKLAAVGDLWISEDFLSLTGKKCVQFIWHRE